MSGSPSVQTLLSQATFVPIYRRWLPQREEALTARLRRLAITRETNILLLNATLGPQLYPSIVDFFAVLRRVQPKLKVTSASYFPEINELEAGVAAKGLKVLSVSDITGSGLAELNRFDVVIAFGPSDALVDLMSMPELASKLVLLDLGFYHQLIESTKRAFLELEYVSDRKAAQRNGVVCYSCQPAQKIGRELERVLQPQLIQYLWFNYIPLGFTYARYYQSDRHFFDIALLGSGGRDYSQIAANAFPGARFLFLGAAERAPEILRLKSELDMTVVSRVDERLYGQVLALCRCVLLPLASHTDNVLLSVVDTLASGLPLIATRQAGFARLEAEGAPIALCDGSEQLSASTRELLEHEDRRRELGQRAITFAKERMDIYNILETIVREQVL